MASAAIPSSGAAQQPVSSNPVSNNQDQSVRRDSSVLRVAKIIAAIAIAMIAVTAIVLTCIFVPVLPAIAITIATAVLAIYLAAYLVNSARSSVVVISNRPRSYVELDPSPVIVSSPTVVYRSPSVYVDPFYIAPRPLFPRRVHFAPSVVSPPLRVVPPVRPMAFPSRSFASSRITPPVRTTHAMPSFSSHVSVGSGRVQPGPRSSGMPMRGMSSFAGSHVAVGSGRR